MFIRKTFFENIVWILKHSSAGSVLVGNQIQPFPDNMVHGANMGPTRVLSAPCGPHVGPMNLAIRVVSSPVDALKCNTAKPAAGIIPKINCGMILSKFRRLYMYMFSIEFWIKRVFWVTDDLPPNIWYLFADKD